MKKIKRVLIGAISLGMLATMSNGVFADEIQCMFNHGDNNITLGSSNDDNCDNNWGHHWDWDDDFTIGNSSDVEIGDSENTTIGDSSKHNHKHHHDDFQQNGWHGFLSFDYGFGHHGNIKDIKCQDVMDNVLNIMDEYDNEYIANGEENWWNKGCNPLSVKISNDDEDYQVKFNPIFDENDEVSSCYMYLVDEDDNIDEGYFLDNEDYQSVKDDLNDAFLSENVVAINNDISDVDDFVKYVENTYQDQDDYFFDVNGDGKVKSNDLLKNKKYLLGTSEDLGNYDCTNDSKSNSADLLMLKKKLLGIM